MKEPNKILLAYGSETPLQVKGSFEAVIKANRRDERYIVYVIGNGSGNLLGKDTAINLGVLKLGADIHNIRYNPNEPFQKNLKTY